MLAALPAARVVGGAVRDALVERAVADVDLATPEPPDAVIAALTAAGLKHAPTGLQHGTVTAISRGRGFEVTTLRRDEATDGRHASVAWTADWAEDAARRDFTMNAMSMQRDGLVFDYFGGAADLVAGQVRFVGEASARIAEDYLRVLRFFRFQGRYGVGAPEAGTLAALREGAAGIEQLSVERVWSELKRILTIPDAIGVVRLMADLGVLARVVPGEIDLAGFERLVGAGAPADALLRLVALQPGAGFAARLRLSRAEVATVGGLLGPAPDPGWSDDDLRRALAVTSAAAWVGRSWLAGGDGEGSGALRARIGAMAEPRFPLAGRDAVKLGVPAGPKVGALLAAVRAWWMAGGCVADRAACRAELARLAAG